MGCLHRVCVSGSGAPAAARHFHAPRTNAAAHPLDPHSKHPTQAELLDAKRPTNQNEALASIIDGELDYDTDLGAASVNNIDAERRAEMNAKAEKISLETNDDFAKRHFL
ncbi:hypothetical protein H4R21_004078 [Coemansia helicoidea]|nr:hypothetical protein H4R21_004078 [Coemansia helicoidea]